MTARLKLDTQDIQFGDKYDPRDLNRLMQQVNAVTRFSQKFLQMLQSGDVGQILTKTGTEDLIAAWATGSGGEPGPPGPPGANGSNGINGLDGVVQALINGYLIDIDSTDPANPVVAVQRGEYLTTTVAAGSVDDFNPAGFGPLTRIVDIDPSAGNTDLTGFIAGEDMQVVTFSNINAVNLLQLMALNVGSAVANRWRMSGDLTLPPNQSITAIYSEDVDLWIAQS